MRSNVSRQKQAGYCHVTVRLPLGDFTAGQMRVLADLAEAYGDGTMRLTVEQNVLYRWVKTESVEPFYQRLAAAGLAAPDALTLSDVVSCPGAESCRLAVTQSRGLGRVLTEHLSARPDLVDLVPSGNIKISGCPNGCGQHHIASIGFQGSVREAGGPRRCRSTSCWSAAAAPTTGVAHFGKVVSKVPVHRLTDAVDRLLDLYQAQRRAGRGAGRVLPSHPAGIGDRCAQGSGAAAAERDDRAGLHRSRREPGVRAGSHGRRVLGIDVEARGRGRDSGGLSSRLHSDGH